MNFTEVEMLVSSRNRTRAERRPCRAWQKVALASLLLAAGDASAVPIAFVPGTNEGSDPVELAGNEDYRIASGSDWLLAGANPGSPNLFALTIVQQPECFEAASNPGVCQGILIGTGPYASEVTWEITNTSGNTGPALLWFTGVAPAISGPSYDPTDVSIDDGPAQPPILGGSFSDVDVIRFSSGGSDYYYQGFYLPEFSNPSITSVMRTFRYEVDGLMLGGGAPQFFTNAAIDFVPEPSSAVLIGLGLLALVSKRPGKRAG